MELYYTTAFAKTDQSGWGGLFAWFACCFAFVIVSFVFCWFCFNICFIGYFVLYMYTAIQPRRPVETLEDAHYFFSNAPWPPGLVLTKSMYCPPTRCGTKS